MRAAWRTPSSTEGRFRDWISFANPWAHSTNAGSLRATSAWSGVFERLRIEAQTVDSGQSNVSKLGNGFERLKWMYSARRYRSGWELVCQTSLYLYARSRTESGIGG